MKVKEESEKVGLKLNIQRTKISIRSHHYMANRWGNSGWLSFSGLQITADGDCSHEIKRCSLHERKAVTNLGSILKSRDITLPTKIHLVKSMVFPVVMYGCEIWTTKESWAPKNWCFWTMVLENSGSRPDCSGSFLALREIKMSLSVPPPLIY